MVTGLPCYLIKRSLSSHCFSFLYTCTIFLSSFSLLPGKVGGWNNYFTAAQSDAFDMIYNEKLQGTGLDFDFEL